MYSRVPTEELEGSPLGSKPWFRIKIPYNGVGMLSMGTSFDATGYLDLLESMGARPEVVGTETVRGTETTRYRIAGQPTNVPAEVEALGRFTARSEHDSSSVELWADRAGRLRRLRTDFDDGEGGPGGGGFSEFEVFDYGAPVAIVPPPLDQVTTQPDVLAQMGAYELAASGNDGGSEWKVFTSPTDGGRCVAVEADVARYFTAVLGSQDGRVMLGCSSSSSGSSSSSSDGVAPPGIDPPGPDPSTAVAWIDTFAPEAVPLADGRALLVSDVPDGTTAVTLRLRGGGTKSVTPSGRWFGAVLGRDEVAKVMVFTTPSGEQACTLHDGTGYVCDSGSAFSTSTVVPTTAP
jgi:hypothetical protein